VDDLQCVCEVYTCSKSVSIKLRTVLICAIFPLPNQKNQARMVLRHTVHVYKVYNKSDYI
jgi:hypothetical protein